MALVIAGTLVVVGLLIECGPQLLQSATRLQWPSASTVGGLLVALGVLAEVLVGVFITQASNRMRELSDSVITSTRERAARAEEQLADVLKRQMPRSSTFPLETFITSLKGKPTANVAITYQPDDGEALTFSWSLSTALVASGWNVQYPIPIPTVSTTGDPRQAPLHTMRMFPAPMGVGGQSTGVSIVLREIPQTRQYLFDRTTPTEALLGAFIDSKWPIGIGRDEALPENVVRLNVGSKP